LLDSNMKLACRGSITNQAQVHGHELQPGWVAVMVKEIVSKSKVEPWQQYPTHSGEVEAGSFVAWPTEHIRPQATPSQNAKANLSEPDVLKDSLHPNQFDSPGTIMSRDRHLRSRK